MKTIKCADHYGKVHEIPIGKFQFRASVYGVLKQGKKYLVVKDRWAKLWEFPGGGVVPSERIKDALKREFREETRIEVSVRELITLQEDFFYAEDRDQAWHSIRLIYRVMKVAGKLKSDGNKEDIIVAKFKAKSGLNSRNTKPAIYQILEIL